VRAAFVNAVCRDAAGIPAAIAGMLEAAAHDREVTRARIRDYRHAAAAVYWDMTPLLVVGLVAFMALRYVSRGFGMQELMVLAGVGSSLFWMVVFFARRMGGGSGVSGWSPRSRAPVGSLRKMRADRFTLCRYSVASRYCSSRNDTGTPAPGQVRTSWTPPPRSWCNLSCHGLTRGAVPRIRPGTDIRRRRAPEI
jgi:hypothetical protein